MDHQITNEPRRGRWVQTTDKQTKRLQVFCSLYIRCRAPSRAASVVEAISPPLWLRVTSRASVSETERGETVKRCFIIYKAPIPHHHQRQSHHDNDKVIHSLITDTSQSNGGGRMRVGACSPPSLSSQTLF